jgi:hypothetical protein
MKIDIIIRKLCDKIKDIDTLKTELDKQKIENDNLKNELIKRRNENEKNINEIRKEIESLKEAINILSQKELYDNKLENKTRKINQMKEDIKKLGKNKKLAEYAKKEEITGKNEFSILESESNLNSKDEFKKDFEEKNNTANEMNSLMNNFKSKLICKSDKSSKIKVKNSDEIKQQNISIDKCKKMIVSSDNEKIIEELIQFEKDEIKQDLNIKKAKFFEIENIKITNIGNDKGFNNLWMVIDTLCFIFVALVGVLVGVWLHIGYEETVHSVKSVDTAGTILIYTQDGEAYLFLDTELTPEELAKNSEVMFRVKTRNVQAPL